MSRVRGSAADAGQDRHGGHRGASPRTDGRARSSCSIQPEGGGSWAHPLRGAAAIIGTGLAGCGEVLPGARISSLLAEAAQQGAGGMPGSGSTKVRRRSIPRRALNFLARPSPVPEYLGIQAPLSSTAPMVGRLVVSRAVISATMAPSRPGSVRWAADLLRLETQRQRQRTADQALSDPPPYEVGYKPRHCRSPAYALAASRHIHQYGHDGRAARRDPRWRARGPWGRAQTPDALHAPSPWTVAEVCAPRAMVCDPFTCRDCCLVTDGRRRGSSWSRPIASNHPAAQAGLFPLGAGGFATTQSPDLVDAGSQP